MEILITVREIVKNDPEIKKWKAPFKKLKKATIRGEEDWRLLLAFEESDSEKIFKLVDGRFKTEVLYEEKEEEVESEPICLGPGNVEVARTQ